MTLLYPKTEQVQAENIEFCEIYHDGAIVRIHFVDLFDIQNSLESLQTGSISVRNIDHNTIIQRVRNFYRKYAESSKIKSLAGAFALASL